jgi:hypothetical protein
MFYSEDGDSKFLQNTVPIYQTHGITSQKAIIFIFTALEASNLSNDDNEQMDGDDSKKDSDWKTCQITRGILKYSLFDLDCRGL